MKKIVYFLIAVLFITSCEPSIEDYIQQWEELEGQVYNYADTYPSFKNEMLAQYEKAKPLWEKVDSSEDEDVKKAQMKLAISTARAGALKRIISLEERIANVERYANEFRDIPSEYFSSKTTMLIDDARKILPEANAILKAKYSSVDSAYVIFDHITNRLKDQEKRMSKHDDEIRRKKLKEKRAEKERKERLKEKEVQ